MGVVLRAVVGMGFLREENGTHRLLTDVNGTHVETKTEVKEIGLGTDHQQPPAI